MEPDVLTVRRILHSGHFDTVLAYYNLLNWTAQEPAPPGVSLWDNGQIIPLATALNIGVIGIRSHAAGALSQQVDRPIPPGTLLAHDVARAQTLDFLLNGPMRTLSQAAMVFCRYCQVNEKSLSDAFPLRKAEGLGIPKTLGLVKAQNLL